MPPVADVSRPVTSATCSTATRASSSTCMRAIGSTLPSGWPSVAIHVDTWRAISQFTGPDPLSILARSRNIGSPANGSSPPPRGPGKRREAMVGPMGTIAVSGVAGHLGGTVVDALRAAGEEVVTLDSDFAPRLDGVGAIVHLGDVPDTRRLLAAAD